MIERVYNLTRYNRAVARGTLGRPQVVDGSQNFETTIEKQQREKLQRQILNENDQSFQAKKTEFEICDELVSRFNDNKGNRNKSLKLILILASKRDLVQTEAYIQSKYSSRDMFWCRLILLTRTPFRDKCLDLLYKSILVSSKDRSQLFDMSCALRGFIRLFVGNEDDTKSNQSIDVHPRKFDILPFSSDGPNNNQSS